MTKRYETRVMVETSEAGTKYYAQYKWYFLWLIPVWECFDIVWSPCNVSLAVRKAHKDERSEKANMQEFAELQCEIYHRICDGEDEKERKEKLHRKTTKVSYYKHP